MSHNKERAEKTCLNCGAQLYGRYCHACGQENVEPKENFGHLVNHFFQDVTHFDGKFFSTLKLLLFKPGFLSKEYLSGKRASYLNPIRMYIFTAFIFFLVLFSLKFTNHGVVNINNSKQYYQALKDSLNAQIKQTDDSDEIKELNRQLTAISPNTDGDTTKSRFHLEKHKPTQFFSVSLTDLPSTIQEYDSMQSRLSPEKRDGWIRRSINKRSILLRQRYHDNGEDFSKDLVENFRHSIPKMMFVFLPLVALVLQLLYIRRRKEFYYVSHTIFVIHFYIVVYILMLAGFLLGWLEDISDWKLFGYLETASILAIFFYLYKAMRNFYHQRRGKAIFKFFIFNISVLILFTFLTIALLAISVYLV